MRFLISSFLHVALLLILPTTALANSTFSSQSANIVIDPEADGLNTVIIDYGGNFGIGQLSAGNALYISGNAQVDGTTNVTNLTNTGAEEVDFITVTSDYTASGKSRIFANTSSGNINITLPSAASSIGVKYTIKKIISDSGYVRIISSDNINGGPNIFLKDHKQPRPSLEIISDGTTWHKSGGDDGVNWPQGAYMIVDIAGGPTAPSYPVSYTTVTPDLTGSGNLAYKTGKIVLKWIEPGRFTMGNTTVNGDAVPEHPVVLTQGFWAGVFEVTQQQWMNVMGSYPSGAQDYTNTAAGNSMPLHQVSWQDIRGSSNIYNWPTTSTVGSSNFMGKLLTKTGLPFDLPTEAEWEYTCRAGTTMLWSYGDTENGAYMWTDLNNTPFGTKEVGRKLPNPWGLYDMHGNVYEWCLDWYATYPTSSEQSDPSGASSGSNRVIRGGFFLNTSTGTGSADRYFNVPDNRDYGLGFRLFLKPK